MFLINSYFYVDLNLYFYSLTPYKIESFFLLVLKLLQSTKFNPRIFFFFTSSQCVCFFCPPFFFNFFFFKFHYSNLTFWGTHFMRFGIEIDKCNQDSNHLLSKQVSSKILGSIDLCIYGGNNFFITPLGFFFFFFWWLGKVEISNYNKYKLLIFTQKIEETLNTRMSNN